MDTAIVSTVNSYISFGLITEILSGLSVKSLIHILCVSKRWYDLIHDPYFINIHLKNSIDSNRDRTIIVTEIARSYCYPKTAGSYWYQNHLSFPYHHNNCFGKAVEIYPPLVRPRKMTNIVGYCNGLVCIHDSETIAIWNPLINKYNKLLREPIIQKPSSFGNGNYCSMFAFGHDPHRDDYKVVRIVEFVDGRYMEIEVTVLNHKHGKKLMNNGKMLKNICQTSCPSCYLKIRLPP